MRVGGGRIALISMIVLSSVMVVATNDIRGDAIVPRDDARGGHDTKTKIAKLDSAPRQSPMRDVEGEQRDDQPLALTLPSPPSPPLRSFRSTSNEPTREKTLAVVILMLRHGRGAR